MTATATTTIPVPNLLACSPSIRILSNATTRVLLVPWGDVTRTDGQTFTVDDATAAATLTYLSKLGRDLVVDYEHQSLGGEFAAPDGQAPAAGWIEQIQPEPGRGIFGLVRWTPRAAQQIRDAEYRYLSPLVEVGPDGHAVRLLGAGLTNTPAIVEPEALTIANSRRLAGYKERNPIMPATATLPNAFAFSGSTTANYGITDEVKRLLALATNSDSDLMQMLDIVIAMMEKAGANNADREEVLMIGSAAMIAIRKYLSELQQSGQLQPNSQHRAAGQHFKSNLRLAVSMANAARKPASPSISPAVTSFTPAADPAKNAWSATVPQSYSRPTGTAAEQPLPNRTAAIALGQMEYRNAVRRGDVMICSERSFVNDTLRGENMAPLTADEVRSYSVSEDPPRRSTQARRSVSSPVANSATPADRARLIANARAEYAGQSKSTKGVCAEVSWVANSLREAGLDPLTEPERLALPV